jgi:hypothetical protein
VTGDLPALLKLLSHTWSKQNEQVHDCRGGSGSFCFGCKTRVSPGRNPGAGGFRILLSESRRIERWCAYPFGGIGVDCSSARSVCRDRRCEHRHAQGWEKNLPSRAAGWRFCDPALEQWKPLRACRRVLMPSGGSDRPRQIDAFVAEVLAKHCDVLARADHGSPPFLRLPEAHSVQSPKNLRPYSWAFRSANVGAKTHAV